MKIASRGIIVFDNKILLVQHKGKSYWSLPGGKLNPNEDIKNALERELFEELGVNAETKDLKFINEFKYPKGKYSLEFFFTVKNPEAFNTDLKGDLSEVELENIKWVNLNDLENVRPSFLMEEIHNIEKSGLKYFSTIE